MPVVRVDEDVWRWLQSQAEPLVDTPNSVLRRISGLQEQQKQAPLKTSAESTPLKEQKRSRKTGQQLNRLWAVGARHALYHWEGTFYENLREFPGALFDEHGYVLFSTEDEYSHSPFLNIGQKLNVHGGINQMPGYTRKV